MDHKEVATLGFKFLERTQLQGSEVPAMTYVMNMLHAIADGRLTVSEPSPEAPPDLFNH